jgi:hypothetical protein
MTGADEGLPHEPAARRRAHRRAWGELLSAATRLAKQVSATEGAAAVDDLMLFGLAKSLTEAPFPSDEGSARLAGEVFLTAFRGLRAAGRPRKPGASAWGRATRR